MLYKSKEEHDLYIVQMLKNVTCDEVAFNIDTKEPIVNIETAYTLLREELTETKEALKFNFNNLEELFTLIRMNASKEDMNKHLDLIAYTALDMMQEAMHVRAVAMKAVRQIENKEDKVNE